MGSSTRPKTGKIVRYIEGVDNGLLYLGRNERGKQNIP